MERLVVLLVLLVRSVDGAFSLALRWSPGDVSVELIRLLSFAYSIRCLRSSTLWAHSNLVDVM